MTRQDAGFPPRRDDAGWLAQAIDLSRMCVASDSAFSVGALVVSARGDLVSTGFSREGDFREHAEEAALRKGGAKGADVRGSTLYTSLEPCSVRLSGRRPCADLIIKAGIVRVVFALAEPATFVRCEGTAKLRRNGLEVVVLEELARPASEINSHLLDRNARAWLVGPRNCCDLELGESTTRPVGSFRSSPIEPPGFEALPTRNRPSEGLQ